MYKYRFWFTTLEIETVEVLLYREAESYVSHHKASKYQCTRFGSVPNLNSQASSPFSEG